MNLYYLSEIQLLAFALVLVRMSAFFVVFPLVEGGEIPPSIKILFSLVVSLVVYPVINARGLPADILSSSLFVLIIKEVFMGIFVGFVAKFFFNALTICGELMTTSLGLSADQLFNPHLDRRVTVVEQYKLLLGGMFFLALNGHHIFLQGIIGSFDFVTVGQTTFNLLPLRDIMLVAQEIMVLGIKLSAPVLGAIFLTNLAMGIVGRAVPQINVLVMSWPVNILVGLGIMFISLPLFLLSLGEALNWNAETLFEILKKF